MTTKFTLIGSGLAGGLLAAYLGRRGYDVDLYERRADPREGADCEDGATKPFPFRVFAFTAP